MFLICDLHVSKEELRLLSCLNFLDHMKKECIKTGDKKLAILGDIFHTSNSIRNQMFVPIFMKLLEMKKEGIELFFIPGNHDIFNKDNSGALAETFSAFGTYIQKSQTIEIDGFSYDFLAYTEDFTEIPNNADVLLTHLSIEGFWPSTSIPQEKFNHYSLVVSGHVHKHQQSGKFYFVGAPYSCNRGESSYQHGYARINGYDITHYDYNDAPEYLTIRAEDFNSGIDYSNKIVTVQLSKKIENFVKLRDILFEKGAVDVTPEFIKEEMTDMSEHKIDANEGVIKSAAKYLREIKAEKVDNTKLLECFKEVLKRCV